jgi:RNA polymerase sigma-70 factor (ECF subfamily)
LTIARFEALKHRTKAAKSPLVFVDQLWEMLAEEESSDSTEIMVHHLEHCMQKLESPKRKVLLKAHTPGIVIRDLAMESGKSEQAMYKTIQRLRKSLLECVNKLRKAEGI